MATRNRIKEFVEYREQARSRGGPGWGSANRNSNLLDDADDDVRIHIDSLKGNSLPPEWVDAVDVIQKDLSNIRESIKSLQRLHDLRLKVKFDDDEAEQEREIDILTQEITRLLRKSEQGLKRIATIGNDRHAHLPQEERNVRLNVMRHLATNLQALSKQFRVAQKDFLHRLQGQEDAGNEYFFEEKGAAKMSMEEAAERGMTEDELAQLQDFKQTADERHQEIIKIAQSINDLATLFRELSVLVIEQGTILDRIDYNCEQTLVKVKKGTEELKIADNYSRKGRSLKIIIFLTVVCIILLIILISKHAGGKDD